MLNRDVGGGLWAAVSPAKYRTAGVFSSLSVDWATPEALFDSLNREFGFDLDWMNPPYGRAIGRWIEKAHRQSRLGSTVVCLLPARTDTSWWHQYCMKGEIRLLRGRLSFKNRQHRGRSRCPFPSAIVIFRPPVNLSEVHCAA